MCDEMKLEIINFMKKYFETAGYPAVHVKIEREGETLHKLYISKKGLMILFKFDKKTILAKYNENEYIYEIGEILKTMVLML